MLFSQACISVLVYINVSLVVMILYNLSAYIKPRTTYPGLDTLNTYYATILLPIFSYVTFMVPIVQLIVVFISSRAYEQLTASSGFLGPISRVYLQRMAHCLHEMHYMGKFKTI